MTNEQFAAYLEQLTMNIDRLLNDAQNQLNNQGVTHETTKTPIFDPNTNAFNFTRQPIDWRVVETSQIEALQPLFWFIEGLQKNILTLDPKRTIQNDNI